MAGWEEMCCLLLETWQEGFQLILFPLLVCLCFHEQLQCGEEMNPSWGRAELLLKGSSEALKTLVRVCAGATVGGSLSPRCPCCPCSQQDALSGIISVLSSALSVLPRSQAGPAPALGTLELFLPPCCRGFSLSLCLSCTRLCLPHRGAQQLTQALSCHLFGHIPVPPTLAG